MVRVFLIVLLHAWTNPCKASPQKKHCRVRGTKNTSEMNDSHFDLTAQCQV